MRFHSCFYRILILLLITAFLFILLISLPACKQIVMMRNLENTPSHGNGQNSRPSTPNHSGVYRSMSNNMNAAPTTPVFNSTTPTTPLGNITNSSKFRTFKNSPITTVSSTCGPFSTPEYQSSAVGGGLNNEVELRPKAVERQNSSNNSSPIRNSLPVVTSSSNFVNVNNNIIKPAIAAKPRLQTPITSVTANVFHTPVKSSSPVPVAPKRSESIKLSSENQFKVPFQSLVAEQPKELPKQEQTTPVATPNISRKNRRKSNLFTPLKSKSSDDKYKNGEVGVGRAIPVSGTTLLLLMR